MIQHHQQQHQQQQQQQQQHHHQQQQQQQHQQQQQQHQQHQQQQQPSHHEEQVRKHRKSWMGPKKSKIRRKHHVTYDVADGSVTSSEGKEFPDEHKDMSNPIEDRKEWFVRIGVCCLKFWCMTSIHDIIIIKLSVELVS